MLEHQRSARGEVQPVVHSQLELGSLGGQVWGLLRPLKGSTEAAQTTERMSCMGPKYVEEETCETDGCGIILLVLIIGSEERREGASKDERRAE